jgi:SAM-dependent methyltransferase
VLQTNRLTSQDRWVLTPEDDAFGAALLDHLLERPSAGELLMEFDTGVSAPALPATWFFQPPARWDALESVVLSAVTAGPVLDLGAGAGRHSLHLQDQGLAVTAIDISPGAIDVCRRRGVRDARVADLTEPPTDQKWRAVLMMCGNLGLAGGRTETRDLLVRLAATCTDDAVIVGDSVDPGDTPERVTMRITYGSLVSPWTSLFNIRPADLEPLVEGTGWLLERHERHNSDHYVVLRHQRNRAST